MRNWSRPADASATASAAATCTWCSGPAVMASPCGSASPSTARHLVPTMAWTPTRTATGSSRDSAYTSWYDRPTAAASGCLKSSSWIPAYGPTRLLSVDAGGPAAAFRMEVAMSRIDETLCSDRRHFLQVALAGGSLLAFFGDDGRDLGAREVPRLVLTEAQWRQRLSPAAYYQMRLADTERPFTGKYWNFYGRGIFRCAACATALYDAATKFHSGTGWPSFYRPIARRNILESTDYSFGMTRIAVSCAGCNSHLGHVF